MMQWRYDILDLPEVQYLLLTRNRSLSSYWPVAALVLCSDWSSPGHVTQFCAVIGWGLMIIMTTSALLMTNFVLNTQDSIDFPDFTTTTPGTETRKITLQLSYKGNPKLVAQVYKLKEDKTISTIVL